MDRSGPEHFGNRTSLRFEGEFALAVSGNDLFSGSSHIAGLTGAGTIFSILCGREISSDPPAAGTELAPYAKPARDVVTRRPRSLPVEAFHFRDIEIAEARSAA